MIIGFKHKGLETLFTKDSTKGINPKYANKIKRILATLNVSRTLNNLKAHPGYKLHQLKGDLESYWSVTVSGNYRIIFKFNELTSEAYDIDFIDYH